MLSVVTIVPLPGLHPLAQLPSMQAHQRSFSADLDTAFLIPQAHDVARPEFVILLLSGCRFDFHSSLFAGLALGVDGVCLVAASHLRMGASLAAALIILPCQGRLSLHIYSPAPSPVNN